MIGDTQKRLPTLFGSAAEHMTDLGEAPDHWFSYDGPSSLLNQVAVKAVDVLKVKQCQILVLAQGGIFRSQAFHGGATTASGHTAGQRDNYRAQEILQHAVLSERPTFIDQRVKPLNREQQLLLRVGPLENLFLFPMRIDTEPVGILALAIDPYEKPFELQDQAYMFAAQAAKVLHRESLPFSDEESIVEIVMALSKALEARDLSTGEHCRQITRLTERIAVDLGCSFHEIQAIRRAALLHDIGKIGIPDNILHKPGPLNEREWVIMKQHPEIGARILRMIAGLSDVARLVLAHHERFDGTGYPLGLHGEEIPMGARILTVVDAFGAMITNRVYRPARSVTEAIEEIIRCSGKDFDPIVVASFRKVIDFPNPDQANPA
jgi:putative nucleotidyltransferase with HDIG domain